MISGDRWHSFDLKQQIGNIGSEIGRIRHWDKQGAASERERAFERALEMIDMTLADPRRKRQPKEIARLREALVDTFMNSRIWNIPFEQLERYCLDFALAARK